MKKIILYDKEKQDFKIRKKRSKDVRGRNERKSSPGLFSSYIWAVLSWFGFGRESKTSEVSLPKVGYFNAKKIRAKKKKAKKLAKSMQRRMRK